MCNQLACSCMEENTFNETLFLSRWWTNITPNPHRHCSMAETWMVLWTRLGLFSPQNCAKIWTKMSTATILNLVHRTPKSNSSRICEIQPVRQEFTPHLLSHSVNITFSTMQNRDRRRLLWVNTICRSNTLHQWQPQDDTGQTLDIVILPTCAEACDGSLDMFSQRTSQLTKMKNALNNGDIWLRKSTNQTTIAMSLWLHAPRRLVCALRIWCNNYDNCVKQSLLKKNLSRTAWKQIQRKLSLS